MRPPLAALFNQAAKPLPGLTPSSERISKKSVMSKRIYVHWLHIEHSIWFLQVKPAFVFDGRNILDHQKLRDIGYIVYALGKPLDPFLHKTIV